MLSKITPKNITTSIRSTSAAAAVVRTKLTKLSVSEKKIRSQAYISKLENKLFFSN